MSYLIMLQQFSMTARSGEIGDALGGHIGLSEKRIGNKMLLELLEMIVADLRFWSNRAASDLA